MLILQLIVTINVEVPTFRQKRKRPSNLMSIYYIKVIYCASVRAIQVASRFPTFDFFLEKIYETFSHFTETHKNALYFVWNDDEDDIILRNDSEFQLALRFFLIHNKHPKFKMLFKDFLSDEDDTECDVHFVNHFDLTMQD